MSACVSRFNPRLNLPALRLNLPHFSASRALALSSNAHTALDQQELGAWAVPAKPPCAWRVGNPGTADSGVGWRIDATATHDRLRSTGAPYRGVHRRRTEEQMNKLRLVSGIVALGAACVVSMASGSSNTPSAAASGQSGGSAASPQVFQVGQPVNLGSWQVTALSAKNPYKPKSAYQKPEAGSKYVTADTQVVNNGDKPGNVSSVLCFKMRDSTGQEYNEELLTGVPKPPDGEVAPGGKLRGTVSYQVPTSANGLLLVFSCDLFSSGSAEIAIP